MVKADFVSLAEQLAKVISGSPTVFVDNDGTGPSHSPKFSCEATIFVGGDVPIKSSGTGITRKEARHEAARNVVYEIFKNHNKDVLRILKPEEIPHYVGGYAQSSDADTSSLSSHDSRQNIHAAIRAKTDMTAAKNLLMEHSSGTEHFVVSKTDLFAFLDKLKASK